MKYIFNIIIIIMDIKMILKQIFFMEELLNYLLNFVMIIVVVVMNWGILLINKIAFRVNLNILMIIGIIIIKLL